MSFRLCPDGGPPRLIRFVGARDMPAPDVLAVLDVQTNVLRIDRDLFDLMDPASQDRVVKTERAAIALADVRF